jgi:hypothetical protein
VAARGKAKLARVVSLQKIEFRFIGGNGGWDRLNDSPEVDQIERRGFSDPLRARPGAGRITRQFNLGLSRGLTTFRSGDWEEVFVPPPQG